MHVNCPHMGSSGASSLLDCWWLSLAGGPGSAALLRVAFGEGARGALPSCWHGLSSALLLEPRFRACFSRVDTAGAGGFFIDRGCLDTLPLVVILLSLCWALARQLVSVAWALTLLRPLLWQKGWPGQGSFSPSLLLAERKTAFLDQRELWEY